MSVEAPHQETPVSEAPPLQNDGIAVPGEAAPQTQQSSGDDYEDRARSQGWVPKDEWRGDPDKWRPADEFVKRGEELLPVALERSRAAERKAKELEDRIAAQNREYAERLQRIEQASTIALQRQREQLEASYQHAMREAVASGDVQRFDQLQQDRHVAVQRFDDQVRQAPQPQPQPPVQGYRYTDADMAAVVPAWRAQNPWHADPVLNLEAQAVHLKLAQEKPQLSLAENLAEVTAEMKRRNPDRFGTAQPKAQIQVPVMEPGGGRMPVTASNRKKGWNEVPSADRAIGETFVKRNPGLFKDVHEWAAAYWEEGN